MVCLNRCRAYLISLLSLSEYLHACLNWDWLIMCLYVCVHSCTYMCVYVYFSISTGWKHNGSLVPRQSTVVKTSEWVFVHGLHHVCAFCILASDQAQLPYLNNWNKHNYTGRFVGNPLYWIYFQIYTICRLACHAWQKRVNKPLTMCLIMLHSNK